MTSGILALAIMPLFGVCTAIDTIAQTRAEQTPSPVALDQLSDTAARERKAERGANIEISQADADNRSSSPNRPDRPDNKTVLIEPVGGRDRCDPSEATRRTVACRGLAGSPLGQSAQAPSSSGVSPEGRLLLLADPSRSSMRGDVFGRTLSDKLGLGDPNGPADQLAGALQDRRDSKGSLVSRVGSDLPALAPEGKVPLLLPPK